MADHTGIDAESSWELGVSVGRGDDVRSVILDAYMNEISDFVSEGWDVEIAL